MAYLQGMRVFYVPCPDNQVAENLSVALLQEKLIACANILSPMTSFYWWEGSIHKSGEVPVLLKTDLPEEGLKKLKERIQQLHPYAVPCILEWEPKSANQEYLNWIHDSLKA